MLDSRACGGWVVRQGQQMASSCSCSLFLRRVAQKSCAFTFTPKPGLFPSWPSRLFQVFLADMRGNVAAVH